MYDAPSVPGQGKINVEFEAYFFTDFISKFHLDQDKSPFGYGNFTFNQKTNQAFDNWILSSEMSNNRANYPTNIDQIKWYQFMEEFKNGDMGKQYVNATIVQNRTPKAFLKIIQLANNPNSGCNPSNGTH